jgi:hypothetical protein
MLDGKTTARGIEDNKQAPPNQYIAALVHNLFAVISFSAEAFQSGEASYLKGTNKLGSKRDLENPISRVKSFGSIHSSGYYIQSTGEVFLRVERGREGWLIGAPIAGG